MVSINGITLDYILDPAGAPHLHMLGGKGVYAAVGMWLWGLRVGLAISVGWDFDLTRLEPVRRAGIDIRGIQRHPETGTIYWAQQYAVDGERVAWNPRRHYTGLAAPPVDPATLPDIDGFSTPDVVRAHDVKLADLPDDYQAAPAYHFAGDEFLSFPGATAGWRQRGAVFGLDADWYTGPALAVDDPAAGEALAPLTEFGAVLPSAKDVYRIFGPAVHLRDAACRLSQVSGGPVAVKLGAQGSLLYRPRLDRFDAIPVVPVVAVDPTGAGDAYAGGFLAGLLRTGDPLEAALWGTVSASFVIEGYGAAYALGTATPEERERRLAGLRRLL